MTLFRLGILFVFVSLSSCTLSTAPEPAEFKLSAEALSKQYRAKRQTGAVRLYAQAIQTSRDEWGRETHEASGGALLVKEAMTPIYAQAPSISITPEFSEVRGQGTVKKGDRLYIGQDEAAKIRIDGAAIVTEGAVVIRGIVDEVAAAEAKARKEEREKADAEAKGQREADAAKKAEAKAEKTTADAEAKAQKEAEAKVKADAKTKAKEEAEMKALADKAKAKAKADADVKAEAYAQAERAKAEAKAKSADESAAKAKTVVSAPAKKSSSSSSKPKAKQAAPAKPKAAAAPAVDRSRLLNLMREPTER